MTTSTTRLRSFSDAGPVAKSYRRFLGRASLTMFALILVSAYLLPLLYMVTTAFQQPGQASTPGSRSILRPADLGLYQGQQHGIYAVPINGTTRNLMLIEKSRESSTVVDPADPSATPFEWQGRWRTLDQAWTFAPEIANFTTAWSQLNFPRLLFNTAAIAILSTDAAVVSALVAYGLPASGSPPRTSCSSSSSPRSSCRSR